VARQAPEITIDNIKQAHRERRDEIHARLSEFGSIWNEADDEVLWQEMVFCFFTGGCSARMGINSLEAVKPVLMHGTQPEIADALVGHHRYPNARSKYVVHSREFLKDQLGLKLRAKLESFDCDLARRDWLVREKGIKGLGYKEASHYLRNIGFRGYAILDKHVLNCLAELGIISEVKPPNTRAKYLSVEQKLKQLTESVGIDFDEMDLVLWSMKTGVILK
jgi:N-glycosylase/DNA lyase